MFSGLIWVSFKGYVESLGVRVELGGVLTNTHVHGCM